MFTNSFQVRMFFNRIIAISYECKDGGEGLSHLIDTIVLYPASYDDLVGRILTGHNEFRLNGAGFKMYYSKGRVRVGGDQYNQYKELGDRINNILPKEEY